MGIKKKRNLRESNPELFDKSINARNNILWSDKNLENGLDPENLEIGSEEKVWVEGRKCGHLYQQRLTDVVSLIKDNKCPYCQNKKILVGFNNLKHTHPDFFNGKNEIQWNYDKNDIDGIFEENYSKGSRQRAWFICKDNHEWEAPISRIFSIKCGCPYCLNKINKHDCLPTEYPELVKEWNYEKNKKNPEDYTSYSGKKVWWKIQIEKYGQIWNLEWEDKIINRTAKKSGCPYLTSKKILKGFNDFRAWCLRENRHDLLNEWDYNKNGNIGPEDYFENGGQSVWWKKELHKEDKTFQVSWKAKICDRQLGAGDPFSSIPSNKVLKGYNDFESYCLETGKQYLLDEWDYELNKKLPSEYTWSSGQKIYWVIKDIKYGQEFELKWEAPIDRRIKGANCPYLSNQKIMAGYNDLATWCKYNNKEYLIKEWNNESSINTYSPFSNRKVNWECADCGHTWSATPRVRARQGCDCPKCASSKGEKRISLFLDNKKIKYKQEYTFDDCINICKLRFDFAVFNNDNNLICLIEYDGEAHDNPISFGCKDEKKVLKNFKNTKKRDKIKDNYCKKNKIPLIRIHYTKFNEIENILEQKFKELGLKP